jgi:DNA-directed RNA polymerase subunit RPC12/RpoP
MADTITVSCPNCKKNLKAPAKMEGKKVKCKNCGSPVKIVAKDDEWGEAKAYGVTHTDMDNRCPFCAEKLPSADAVVCLTCGYNMRTRTRMESQILHPITKAEWLIWWAPGIVALLVSLTFAGAIALIWAKMLPSFLDWLEEWPSIKIYTSLGCAFIAWGSGYFAFLRLVKNPRPPEFEMKFDRED